MNFVTLDSKIKANHGALDPIIMLDKDDAISVAKNMLNYLLNSNKHIQVTMNQVTAISDAINTIAERRQSGEQVGLKHVLELLLHDEKEEIQSVGRFYNNILCLITQSVHDAESDDDTTGFGTVFAFKEKNELSDILEHMDLETSKENLEWLNNMISGQCLYRDVYNNLNMITITNIFEGIDPLLKPIVGFFSLMIRIFEKIDLYGSYKQYVYNGSKAIWQSFTGTASGVAQGSLVFLFLMVLGFYLFFCFVLSSGSFSRKLLHVLAVVSLGFA